MKTVGKKYSDSGLLLKSVCCVLGVAAFALLAMHHAAPERTGDKGYGSGVKLLIPSNIADAEEFYRWANLNTPTNIFGYNSQGLFTRSVALKSKTVLPEVRGGMPQEAFLPLPEVPASGTLPAVMEKELPSYTLLTPESRKGAAGFAASEIPVFSEKGELLCKLSGVSDIRGGNPLLVRAENFGMGTRFRIIESSGDRNFDDRVTAGLEQKLRSGSRFSGILAVWPKGEKEK